MADIYPSLAQCAIVATAFKILLFPAYYSALGVVGSWVGFMVVYFTT
ncbi:hypothetical protein EMGR_008090 [Emarellia grisea]